MKNSSDPTPEDGAFCHLCSEPDIGDEFTFEQSLETGKFDCQCYSSLIESGLDDLRLGTCQNARDVSGFLVDIRGLDFPLSEFISDLDKRKLSLNLVAHGLGNEFELLDPLDLNKSAVLYRYIEVLTYTS